MAGVARGHVERGGAADVLVCTDAYDVVCTAEQAGAKSSLVAARILRLLRSSGAHVLAGAEEVCSPLNCAPLGAWWAAHDDGERDAARSAGGYKFVNGGVLVGRADALAQLYGEALESGQEDDQLALSAYANAHPERVALDVRRELVWNRSFRRQAPPRAAPVFLHFPGSGRGEAGGLLREAQAAHCGVHGILDAAPRANLTDGILKFGPPAAAIVFVVLVLVALLVGWSLARRQRRHSPTRVLAAWEHSGRGAL